MLQKSYFSCKSFILSFVTFSSTISCIASNYCAMCFLNRQLFHYNMTVMLSDLFLANLVSFFSWKCLDFTYKAYDGKRNQLLQCFFFHMMDSPSPTGVLLNYEVMMPFYPGLTFLFVYWRRFLLRYSGWAYSLLSLFSFLLLILVYSYMIVHCICFVTPTDCNSQLKLYF